MKPLAAILAALTLASCETTTTYYPDGGKTVVHRADREVIILVTKGLGVLAYQYPIESNK